MNDVELERAINRLDHEGGTQAQIFIIICRLLLAILRRLTLTLDGKLKP